MTTLVVRRRVKGVVLCAAPPVAQRAEVPKIELAPAESGVARALRIRREVQAMFAMAKRGET